MSQRLMRRQRLQRCYRGQPVDRPAVYGRTGMPVDDPTYDRLRVLLRERTELKAGWSAHGLDAPDPIDARTEPHSADWDRRIRVLHTPAGDLTATSLLSRRGQPGLHERFFVDGPEAPVARVFDGFLAMGADVLHPIEPPPMGDTAAEARQRAGKRICLEGNLQIHRLYEATPQEICAEVEALIGDAFDGGGLIVSASASPYIRVAGDACFPQYEAMVDTVLAHGSS